MRFRAKGTRQLLRGFAFLFVIAAVFMPSMEAYAQLTGGIGGRVANPDLSSPRYKSLFIYTLEPGQTKQDQLLVVNPTEETETINISTVDGVATNTGDYTCKMEAEALTGSGSWVTLSRDKVTVPAKSEVKVDFTVTVPERADVGEHNGCLTLRIDGDEPKDTGGGIFVRTRQAIRMVVTIPGELKRQLAIEDFQIEQYTDSATKTGANGEAITAPFYTLSDMTRHRAAFQKFYLTASNEGNVSADIDMRVKLTNMFGKEIANIGGEYPIVPGVKLTKDFTTELRPLFGGWYKAAPSIRFDKRLGAFGTQTDSAEYETITAATQTFFLWPTQLGWVIIGTVLALLVIFIRQTTGRVKREHRLRRSAEKYTVKKADTIQSLAKKSKVDWRDLAKLNDIEEPYSLEVGQKILLPTLYTRKRRVLKRKTKPTASARKKK